MSSVFFFFFGKNEDEITKIGTVGVRHDKNQFLRFFKKFPTGLF